MIFLKSFAIGLLTAFAAAVALALTFYFSFVAKVPVPAGAQVGFTLDFLLSRFVLPIFAVFLVGTVVAYLNLRSR